MSAPFVVIRDTDLAPPRGAVIAIGNFDGVHHGHRAVIDAAITIRAASFSPTCRSSV
jgi:riboflavin kinase / FMN adenylyltransferase